ncbi:hypothetical protein GCM10022393_25790 [Aquimarina addita]|uniref:Uncharacterized protein n=1 Tax=Aquimarina addita TaxID=870485 RepID=A0ABP6UPP7_9FLAO
MINHFITKKNESEPDVLIKVVRIKKSEMLQNIYASNSEKMAKAYNMN